jgi:uracil-DNA glycosylase
MTPRQFVSELGNLRFDNAFNPYSQRCSVHDVDDAPYWRFKMLADTIEIAASAEVDAIWVGRDLGYRGGRRTGLAFTDDVHLSSHQSLWGIDVTRPTKGALVAERSATVVWKLLEELGRPILLWNAFPLHPHVAGNPFTNRLHTADEHQAGTQLLRKLVGIVRPKRLVAIGNDAEKAIRTLSTDIEIVKVRHPSFGGQTQFGKEIRSLYGSREWKLL